ncbi:MAG: hypothetical protein CTY39_02625 [Hyphomicrobium sp.]|nr:MAG: hypothetical protein CTY39_02625 [Hyphomicrobium sp.]
MNTSYPAVQTSDAISQYRSRVSAILNLPEAQGKYHSAVSVALEGGASVDVAAKALATMPTDEKANLGFGAKQFGKTGAGCLLSPDLTDERLRIGAILRTSEAEGRERTAIMLACDSGSDLKSALRILSKTPQQSAQPASSSLEDTHKASGSQSWTKVVQDFNGRFAGGAGGGSGSRSSWSNSVAKINDEIAGGGDKDAALARPFDS